MLSSGIIAEMFVFLRSFAKVSLIQNQLAMSLLFLSFSQVC